MRCYICDVPLTDTVTDPLTGKIKHCHDCDEVIQDNLNSLERRGRKDDDNDGELPLIEEDWDKYGLLSEEELKELSAYHDEFEFEGTV